MASLWLSAVQPGCKLWGMAPFHQARADYLAHTFRPRPNSSENGRSRMRVRAGVGGGDGGGGPGSFLTMEEAGLVEMVSLDMHEKFLCRLTISSLNLLRVIAEQEGGTIEELNAGRVCDWFLKDKAKRETDINSATLKWESNDW